MVRYIFRCLPVILMLFMPLVAIPQVVVERSGEKIIVAGTQYYLHQVNKGETIYSISRAYSVTTDELVSLNPQITQGLKSGDTLMIPIRAERYEPTEEETTGNKRERDEANFYYHELQRGETIYALSKRYGVSENEIISSNVGIDITKLSVGTEVVIPKRQFNTAPQSFYNVDTSFVMHKVEKGETMYSLSKKYGMTVRELRKENKNTSFLVEGDYIKIPSQYASKIKDEAAANAQVTADVDLMPQLSLTPQYETTREYTPINRLNGSVDVAVLLPFFLKENSVRYEEEERIDPQGNPYISKKYYPEEWVYPGSQGFVEMYEGILLAADTLRNLGLDINIHTYDISRDSIPLINLIRRGELDDMDLIIGPVYGKNLSIASDYAARRNIPVVSPVQLLDISVVKNYSNLFLANPSIQAVQDKIASKIADYHDNNIVFVHADTIEMDKNIKYFKNKLISELSSMVPYDDINLKEYFFYNRTAFNNDTILRLDHAMSKTKENVVIIASESWPVISEVLQEIHTLKKRYSIKVFGYPIVRGLDNIGPQYLFESSLLVYSPFWIDYNEADVEMFLSKYFDKFHVEPSEMSYVWLGYDITYYFLSGIALHGRDFVSNPSIHHPDLLQTEFDFRKHGFNGGYENNYLFPIRYGSDYSIVSELDAFE